MNGVMEKIICDTPHVRPTRDRFVQPSGYIKTFYQLQTITPTLHFSNNPIR